MKEERKEYHLLGIVAPTYQRQEAELDKEAVVRKMMPFPFCFSSQPELR